MGDCKTVSIGPSFDPSGVEVEACSRVFPLTLRPGDRERIPVQVANPNDVEATGTLVIESRGGREFVREPFSIPPGGGTVRPILTAPSLSSTTEFRLQAHMEQVIETSGVRMMTDGGVAAESLRIDVAEVTDPQRWITVNITDLSFFQNELSVLFAVENTYDPSVGVRDPDIAAINVSGIITVGGQQVRSWTALGISAPDQAGTNRITRDFDIDVSGMNLSGDVEVCAVDQTHIWASGD